MGASLEKMPLVSNRVGRSKMRFGGSRSALAAPSSSRAGALSSFTRARLPNSPAASQQARFRPRPLFAVRGICETSNVGGGKTEKAFLRHLHMSGFWSRAAQDAAEAQDAARARYVPYSSLRSGAASDRPRWLLRVSLLAIFIAGGTAVVVDWYTGGALFCTVTNRLSGPDIPLAAHVVMITCAVGFLLSVLLRARPLLLSNADADGLRIAHRHRLGR
jgi:hypothetical protein